MKYLTTSFFLIILVMLLSSCTNNNFEIRYQCIDGNFSYDPNLCPFKECPQINCSSCPVKIEQKNITQKIYVCPDKDTEVSNKEECLTKFIAGANYQFGDDILAGDFEWKFVDYYKTKQIGDFLFNDFYGVNAKGEYLIINVEVENVGNSPKYIEDDFVKLIDEKNRTFTPDLTAAIYLKPDNSAFSFDLINPGLVKRGYIVFDVPTDLKVAKIRVMNNLLESNTYDMTFMV